MFTFLQLQESFSELSRAVDRLKLNHNNYYLPPNDKEYKAHKEDYLSRECALVKLFNQYCYKKTNISNKEPNFNYNIEWELIVDFDKYWTLEDIKFLAKILPGEIDTLAYICATDYNSILGAVDNKERLKSLEWIIENHQDRIEFNNNTEDLLLYPESEELLEKHGYI